MAWRSPSRHARPKGRGAIKAAYADLQAEMGDVRRHRYADTLENTRLTALVDALTVQVSRLQGELSSVRAELQAARTAPQQRDPYVAVLAAEAAELRSAVAGQQSVLETLTARIGDLLDRDAAREAAAAAAAAATVRAAEAIVPAALAQPPVAEPVAPVEPAAAPVPVGVEPVIHLAEPIEATVAPLPPADPELDDLALLRLALRRPAAAGRVCGAGRPHLRDSLTLDGPRPLPVGVAHRVEERAEHLDHVAEPGADEQLRQHREVVVRRAAQLEPPRGLLVARHQQVAGDAHGFSVQQ